MTAIRPYNSFAGSWATMPYSAFYLRLLVLLPLGAGESEATKFFLNGKGRKEIKTASSVPQRKSIQLITLKNRFNAVARLFVSVINFGF